MEPNRYLPESSACVCAGGVLGRWRGLCREPVGNEVLLKQPLWEPVFS